MLKKLVKYGNSTALILDKAILELLDMEEGSTIKIKTDGKSIIITPHVKIVSDTVHETFTNDQAYLEANIKESLKKYTGLDTVTKEKLAKKYQSIIQRHQTLSAQLSQNSDYFKEVTQIAKKIDPTSPQYVEAFKALRNKFCPELTIVEKEIQNFEINNKLVNTGNPLDEKQQTKMEQAFLAVHKKYANAYRAYEELLNNPEYQHQAQLIAEKYNNCKDSADYLNAIDTLTDKYNPEIRKAKNELKAVTELFAHNKTK